MADPISNFNALQEPEARASLVRCCGSSRWAQWMLEARPIASVAALHAAADSAWDRTTPADRMEAFGHHPRIGARRQEEVKFASTRSWSEGEQAGTASANQSTVERLAFLNDEYFTRFGYVFLICATGKTAEEMLAALESRLKNEPGDELRIASEELRKITHLRLDKLLLELT